MHRRPDLLRQIKDPLLALESWRTSFNMLDHFGSDRSLLLSLKVQFFQTFFTANTVRGLDKTLCDSFEKDFDQALEVIEDYLALHRKGTCSTACQGSRLQRVSFLCNRFASCLCIIVEKCRVSRIRRRAIELLRTIALRGVFDTAFLLAFCQHVDSEEERAKMISGFFESNCKATDTSKEARFI